MCGGDEDEDDLEGRRVDSPRGKLSQDTPRKDCEKRAASGGSRVKHGLGAWRVSLAGSRLLQLSISDVEAAHVLVGALEAPGPSPFPGDLSNPGIESRSPSLQADSLSSEPPGKPQSTLYC